MKVAVVDYNDGNTQSVLFALKREGIDGLVTSDKEVLRSADKVIFPGVGEASSTMNHLRASGLDRAIVQLTQPVLGICLGMQLMCSWSEEGATECLGIFPQEVRRFSEQAGEKLKIPHIGWNEIFDLSGALFKEVPEHSFVYFVHSYRAEPAQDSSAHSEYSGTFSAALWRDNFFGVQFHPERSGEVGAQILRNFLKL